jgi:coenzyme F420-0:L-glutamate ligase/coenzyme F420-1:gamma-L-glutamate ligase
MSDGITILPVDGVGEIGPGDDLATVLLAALGAEGLQDGDVVVVTSKVVSKSEGRLAPATTRDAAIEAETVAAVATRGPLRIVRTRTGLVLAAAGVDASNTPDGTILLLPIDPDASADRLRTALSERTGCRIGVVITDTAGRPWREGQTDLAIGASGLLPLEDHRGRPDAHGRVMDATVVALIDEIAAAADLVKGKTRGRPFALVRGLASYLTDEPGPGAAAVVRSPQEDLFPLGAKEAAQHGRAGAVAARRTVRTWTTEPVPLDDVRRIVDAAITAPAPHGTTPWRMVLVDDDALRTRLLDAMRERWRADLRGDGLDPEAIDRRVRRGDLLRRAPALLIPVLVDEGRQSYRDDDRRRAEDRMFWLSAGAFVQNALIQAAALGYGGAWVSSTLFCAPVVREVLAWPPDWEPLGAIGLGRPEAPVAERGARDSARFLHIQ